MYRCRNVNFTCHRKFLYNFIYLFLTVLSLHCCLAFSLAAPSGSCSLVVKCRLLTAAASPAVEHGFQGRPASAAVAMGLVTPRHVGSSQIRDPARVSCLGRRLLTQCATKYYSSVCFILGFFLGGSGFQPLKNVKIIFSSQAVWVEIRFSQQALLKHFKATATPGRGVTEMTPLWMRSLGVFSDCLESDSQGWQSGAWETRVCLCAASDAASVLSRPCTRCVCPPFHRGAMGHG